MCMITPFLKYVAEGRVIRRQSDLSRYTFDEITERIYLSFLALALLKNFSHTKRFAKSYADQTLTYSGFDRVRTTTNDLHNMLAVVSGDQEIVKKLANPVVAQAQRQRRTIPVMSIKRYLRSLDNDFKFLTQLETALGIQNVDYRNLRRAIADYSNLDHKRKGITTTRLLQALRAKLPGTDLQRQTQAFADKQRLELDNVIDGERNISPEDAEMTPDEMNAYRVLVGSSNVRRAKIAADMIRRGRAVPAPIMASFAPIVTMIDDIAKGGYTFVKLLQAIHARAKSKSNR